MCRYARLVLLLLAAGASFVGNVPPAAEPTVIATIPVGTWPLFGVGVNTITNRIYVANVGSNNVSVIDGATNAVVATVSVGDFPKAVGANPNTNRIYVTNDNDNTVSVIQDLPPAVGGIAEYPDVAQRSIDSSASQADGSISDWSYAQLAGLAAGALLALTAGAWYAGRRWLR